MKTSRTLSVYPRITMGVMIVKWLASWKSLSSICIPCIGKEEKSAKNSNVFNNYKINTLVWSVSGFHFG